MTVGEERRSTAAERVRRSLASAFESDALHGRVLAMEGLRGAAILLVFLCHYKLVVLDRLSPGFDSTLFRAVAQVGGTGVDLFFLLSGMLIYRAALRRDLHLGRYFARRVQRIYPTFLVAFTIYFLASVVAHQGPRRVPGSWGAGANYVFSNVLLLPGLADIQPLIPAAWSLSYELAFYLAIPLLVLGLRMTYWTRLERCALWVCLLVGHVAYVLALPKTLPVYRYQSGNFLRFGMFLAGMLVFEVLNSVRGADWLTWRRQAGLSAVGCAAGVAYWMFLLRTVDVVQPPIVHFVLKAVLTFVIYTSLALATLGETGIWSRIFSATWLRWTGNISYSFYLIHGIVLNLVIAVLLHVHLLRAHPRMAAVTLLPICFGVTTAAAAAMFLVVEKPLSLQTKRSQRVAPRRELEHAATPAPTASPTLLS